MNIKRFLIFFVIGIPLFAFPQDSVQVLYKQVDTVSLYMDVHYPSGYQEAAGLPAMVFFFGGGWNSGSIQQFRPHAAHFTGRGMVCFLVDYRVMKRQGTTPFDAVSDAKSAMRYIRSHAADFHIHPDKIVAAGGSAGGHLAAATALIDGYNDSADDLSVSCKPNALVLFNPVIDNGPDGYGYERIGDAYSDFSPLHAIRQGAPPTLFMLGTEDHLIPVATAQRYQQQMEAIGSRCDLKLYEGGKHGFFNFGRKPSYYDQTLQDADDFLVSLGLLQADQYEIAVTKQKPNIIFILTDDLGSGDIGVFFQNQRKAGQPRLYTPSLDRMAAEGAMLMQHYCAAPVCAPSRASILLGKTQGHANVRDNQFDKALEDNYTVASVLKQAGYVTAAIGKWGLQGKGKGPDWPAHPLKRGFDYYYGYIRHSDGHEHYPKEGPYKGAKEVWENYTEVSGALDKCYTGDLFTAAAKKYIQDHQTGADADKPFFLYLAYDTPHAKLQLPTQAYPAGGGLHGGVQWVGEAGHMINTASGQIDSFMDPQYADATYDDDSDPATPEVPWPDTYKRFACVNKRIDQQVGDLLKLLEDLHIDGNTLVVFTSDNGPSKESYLPKGEFVPYEADFFDSFAQFDGIKRDLYEGGIRTSTIVRWPEAISAGKIIDRPNASYDWLPTFTDMAGLPAPMGVDGVSLLPALTGKGKQVASLIYSEYFHPSRVPGYTDFVPEHRGKQRGQMQLIRMGDYVGVRYDVQHAEDDFEIYDIRKDPQQTTNRAGSLPELQAQMKARVLQLRKPDTSAARPYDDAPVPAVTTTGLTPGLIVYAAKSHTPWIPQVSDTVPAQHVAGLTDQLPESDPSGDLLHYKGYIQIPVEGAYIFSSDVEAQSFLKIHRIQVIDNDFHPGATSGSVVLAAGLHPIEWYVRRSAGAGHRHAGLIWQRPDGTKEQVPDELFFTSTGYRE